MIAITFLVLVVVYAGLLLLVGFKLKSWTARITAWLVLLSPPGYWLWTYQAIQYEHKQACARDGGLKVFIQPEKADRIQLDRDSFSDASAKGLLDYYSPRLVLVEASDGNFNGRGQRDGYFAYSPEPATTALPKKDWVFNKVPLDQPSSDMYVLTDSHQTDDGHRNKTITTLTRNGKLYASWVSLQYMWSTNGGAPIGWRCFGAGSPEGAGQYPHRALTELILK